MEWTNIIGDSENQKYIDEYTLCCRYLLEKKGNHELIVLGLNPSIADSEVPDRTMKKVMHYAEQEGFDGFAMINLYPRRAIKPYNLREFNQKIHKKNLEKIDSLFLQIDNPIILLAFGGNIMKIKFLTTCLFDVYNVLRKYNPSWKCLDVGKTGFPKHPLYLRKSLKMKSFDIDNFISSLQKNLEAKNGINICRKESKRCLFNL